MSLIHRYQSNGYNIVLDINSGCIHLVDLVTYEVLPYMEEGLAAEAIVEKLEGSNIQRRYPRHLYERAGNAVYERCL